MRRLIKNIGDPILRKELEAIWEVLSRIETKTAEPTVLNTPPGEIVMYNGKLYINDQNTIRNLTPTGSDATYLKADGSVALTGNLSVTAGKTIDGVDVGAHKAATAKAGHDGGVGTHTHASAGAEGGTIKLDDLATPDDNTDLNASKSKHGLLPKLDDIATNFLNGKGNWASVAWDGDIADINLDGATDIGAALADEDLILVDDGAGGTNRKCAMSRVAAYVIASLPFVAIGLDPDCLLTLAVGTAQLSLIPSVISTITWGL